MSTSSSSEEKPESTQFPETTGAIVATSSNTTQAVASNSVSSYLHTTYPQQYPPGYSYRSSGYQNSFGGYQECPINFDRPDYTSPPMKPQELYNVYCLNDHVNHMARRAFDKGWISEAQVKRIFHRGLGETFDAYQSGLLASHYVDNMINYGKFYKYLSRS